PTVIAHGMFSAAAVLANIEARLPDQVRYSVRFGKPVILPATTGLYIDENDRGSWDLSLRNIAKGYPHLTGSVRPL
ncbi:MaoC/PaaZ C-terminal domain-containing protein, partial [Mycobacterium montefiorense]